MFGWFRKPRASSIAKRIADHGTNIEFFVRKQVGVAIDHTPCSLDEIWRLDTTMLYLFGACDALTCEFPIEVRQKVGPAIIEMAFLRLATNVFGVAEADARRRLSEAFEVQRRSPRHATIVEGGFDGIAMMQGKPAAGLTGRLYDIFVEGGDD